MANGNDFPAGTVDTEHEDTEHDDDTNTDTPEDRPGDLGQESNTAPKDDGNDDAAIAAEGMRSLRGMPGVAVDINGGRGDDDATATD